MTELTLPTGDVNLATCLGPFLMLARDPTVRVSPGFAPTTDPPVPPPPAVIARLTDDRLHQFGIERQRAENLIAAARFTHRAHHAPLPDHETALTALGMVRGDDDRMIQLLEPYRPHRYRVIRLAIASGSRPPRRATRAPINPIRGRQPVRPTGRFLCRMVPWIVGHLFSTQPETSLSSAVSCRP